MMREALSSCGTRSSLSSLLSFLDLLSLPLPSAAPEGLPVDGPNGLEKDQDKGLDHNQDHNQDQERDQVKDMGSGEKEGKETAHNTETQKAMQDVETDSTLANDGPSGPPIQDQGPGPVPVPSASLPSVPVQVPSQESAESEEVRSPPPLVKPPPTPSTSLIVTHSEVIDIDPTQDQKDQKDQSHDQNGNGTKSDQGTEDKVISGSLTIQSETQTKTENGSEINLLSHSTSDMADDGAEQPSSSSSSETSALSSSCDTSEEPPRKKICLNLEDPVEPPAPERKKRGRPPARRKRT
eukprot:TRINITY_DN3863_c0_g2_i2.p1 TRINITY_DN3863_c0_g2~~TRINITY_DN3863_c0_g2_i2.p1  ORF type:complete len:327 (+),score=127.88 TRINITY_DN3863_c0_g2_i2:97-981(+)